MQLVNLVFFQKILLALAIGALVGVEREKRAKGETFAGIRTFMLVCLFGLLTPYVSQLVGSQLPVYIGLLIVGGMAVAGYVKSKSIGLTTEVAFVLTHVIGLMLFFESYPYFISIALGILLTLILLSLEPLHGFAKHLTKKEIRDAVVFAVLVFIVLPLLPNRAVDPFGALNPYLIWLSIVVVLSISFAGYVAMKVFGARRGLALTGFFGGLASSTSVAISMAEKARKSKGILYMASFAVVVAASTMFLRQLLVTSLFNSSVAWFLILPLAALGIAGYVLSYSMWKKTKRGRAVISIGSPIALTPALKFGVFFAIVLLVSRLAQTYFPAAIYLVAIIAGLIEVDAITISLASLALTTLSPVVAAVGILLAAMANTFSKWFLVRWLGTKKMALEVGKVFAVLIIVGVIVLFLLKLVYL